MNVSTEAFPNHERKFGFAKDSYFRIHFQFLINKEEAVCWEINGKSCIKLRLFIAANHAERATECFIDINALYIFLFIRILLELNGSFVEYLKSIYYQKNQR